MTAVEVFLDTLLRSGEEAANLFNEDADFDHPLLGYKRYRGLVAPALEAWRRWLMESQAEITPLATTLQDLRAVHEATITLYPAPFPEGALSNPQPANVPVVLPVALVADSTEAGIDSMRVYHSTWPLTGAHRVRAPIAPPDPFLPLSDVVGPLPGSAGPRRSGGDSRAVRRPRLRPGA